MVDTGTDDQACKWVHAQLGLYVATLRSGTLTEPGPVGTPAQPRSLGRSGTTDYTIDINFHNSYLCGQTFTRWPVTLNNDRARASGNTGTAKIAGSV